VVVVADKSKKYPENIKGKYYVDKECIACDACVMVTSKHFNMDPDDGHAFVIAQPQNEADEALCREAMEGCPVEAIGNDGDS
jgi:ferredoxin